MKTSIILATITLGAAIALPAAAQAILPFPPKPSASTATQYLPAKT